MAYNSKNIAVALKYYVDNAATKFLGMQAAMGAKPTYPSANPNSKAPRKGAAKETFQAVWDGLSDGEKAARVSDEALRQSALATQGAIWLAVMEEDVDGVASTIITQTQLYDIVEDGEESQLGPGALQMLNNMYSLPQLDFVSGGKAETQFQRLFPTTPGPSRDALDVALAVPKIPRWKSLGLPAPYLGVFEVLVKRAR